MPEGYTHVRTAVKALHKSRIKRIDNLLAFGAGANGPDPLFFHKIWKPSKKRSPDWPAFGGRMHREKTGNFLFSLVKNAASPVQKAYALGFLTHYATDLTLHPYVEYITTAPGAPYTITQGHGFFEIALDSHLHEEDFGSALVPAERSTPTPPIEELMEIASLLSRCVMEVYAVVLDEKTAVKAFQNIRALRKFLCSRNGFKRPFFSLLEKAVLKDDGLIMSHVTPAEPLKELPTVWLNTYTGERSDKNCFELLGDAEKLGAVFIDAACDFWGKSLDEASFRKIVKSRSYESGIEDELSVSKV